MKYKQYKYKFYLNMNHAIVIDGSMGEIHPHTWEITMDLTSIKDGITLFSKIEKRINELLDEYQDRFLNEIEPFTYVNPTLENVCDFLSIKVRDELLRSGWILLMMEMSETPSRAYVVNMVQSDYAI